MKNNICIFGMVKDYTSKVAKRVADKFEMFFADVDALIEFDLINTNMVKDICGKEYLEKQERKKVKQVATFENTLITLRFALLNDDSNLKVLNENCLMIYLKLDKPTYDKKLGRNKNDKLNKLINLSVFDERNKILEEKADLIVDCSELDMLKSAKLIKDTILKHYGCYNGN